MKFYKCQSDLCVVLGSIQFCSILEANNAHVILSTLFSLYGFPYSNGCILLNCHLLTGILTNRSAVRR
jgi:hypothetical protein